MTATLGFVTTLRNARANAVTAAIDTGTAGELRLYDGTQPATGGTATNLLCTNALTSPAAAGASGGVLTLSAIADGTGTAAAGAGTAATWGRIVDSSGAVVCDMNAGASATAIVISPSATIVQSQTVSVTSATLTEGNA